MRKFMRTRAPPPPAPTTPPGALLVNGHAHKTNGHANGSAGGQRRDDSTLSSSFGPRRAGSERSLWQDEEFPPARALPDRRRAGSVLWMRPHELCSQPRFLGDEADEGTEWDAQSDAEWDADSSGGAEWAARWLVVPGELGDAAVCTAAAALALTPRLLARAVPPQSFQRGYTGVFRFRFWVFGTWREVAVDDRLPARGSRLLCAHSGLPDDYTMPLLEKAYAKLHGGYAHVTGGVAGALTALTGGVVQSFALARQPPALVFQVLNSGVPRCTLLLARPGAAGRAGGLLSTQAYSVLGLARARPPDGADAALVRVRAAGGRGAWRGAWARGGPEWRALAPRDRALLDERARQPQTFWMSFADFLSAFSWLELVHVGPDDWLAEPALRGKRPWRAVLARRRWRAGYNAGGDPSCKETTGCNPQFHVVIPGSGAGKCHVVVSVTQQYRPGGARALAAGFAVYALGGGGARAALARPPLDVTHDSRAREVATFFTLPPGEFLVVPHTRRPHTDAAFLLRILTDDHTDVWEVNEDNMVIRNISEEFPEEGQPVPPEVQAAVKKLLGNSDAEELDAHELRGVLRRAGGGVPASPALCRALVMLRDARLAGRMRCADLPALLALLRHWQHIFAQHAGRSALRCAAPHVSSYKLRALLWAAGVTASNKVLEVAVLRFAHRARLSLEGYVLALARLLLAHERYRSLDTKMKSNPLSLEEMILMTIYS